RLRRRNHAETHVLRRRDDERSVSRLRRPHRARRFHGGQVLARRPDGAPRGRPRLAGPGARPRRPQGRPRSPSADVAGTHRFVGGGDRVAMRRVSWLAWALLFAPGCAKKEPPRPMLPPTPSATAPSADRLLPGELAEGKEKAMGLAVPREMEIL